MIQRPRRRAQDHGVAGADPRPIEDDAAPARVTADPGLGPCDRVMPPSALRGISTSRGAVGPSGASNRKRAAADQQLLAVVDRGAAARTNVPLVLPRSRNDQRCRPSTGRRRFRHAGRTSRRRVGWSGLPSCDRSRTTGHGSAPSRRCPGRHRTRRGAPSEDAGSAGTTRRHHRGGAVVRPARRPRAVRRPLDRARGRPSSSSIESSTVADRRCRLRVSRRSRDSMVIFAKYRIGDSPLPFRDPHIRSGSRGFRQMAPGRRATKRRVAG